MTEDLVYVDVEKAQHAHEILKKTPITSLPITGDIGYRNQTGFRAENVLRKFALYTAHSPEKNNLWELFVVGSKDVGIKITIMEDTGVKTRNLVIGSFNAFVDAILANDPLPDLTGPKTGFNWQKECAIQIERAERAENKYNNMVDEYKILLEDYNDLEAATKINPKDQSDKFEIEVLKKENKKLLNSLMFWTERYQNLFERK